MTNPPNILVFNAGSSSLKFALSAVAFFGVFLSSPKWPEQTLVRRATTAALIIAMCVTAALIMPFFPDGPLHSLDFFH